MRLKQISVFLENISGRLEKMCEVLANANVNLETLMMIETGDFGIARIIVADADSALTALKTAGIAAKVVEVLAVDVKDEAGSLLKILSKLSAEGINVEYMYAMTKPHSECSVMVMSFKDLDAAERVLGI